MLKISLFFLLTFNFCWSLPNLGIHGGDTPDDKEFTYSAKIIVWTGTRPNLRHCGGALISNEDVLTSARCVTSNGSGAVNRIAVVLGTNDLSRRNNKHEVGFNIEPENAIVHPKYDAKTGLNDIAIIKLNEKVTTTDYITIADLPPASQSTWNYTDEFGDLSGWGAESPSSYISFRLNFAELVIVDPKICQNQFGEPQDNKLCGQGFFERKAACHGDSGSPFVQDNTIVGIVSNDDNKLCNMPDTPTSFTKVAAYLDFIATNSKAKIH